MLIGSLDPKGTAAKTIHKLVRTKKSWVDRDEFYKKWNRLRERLFLTPEYKLFLREVRERAGYRCEKCANRTRGHVHHKVRVYDDPTMALDPANGEYLCPSCHRKEHAKHGTR